MTVQIQIRRGTAATWTSVNPLLAEGELGVELDTDKFKIGDGTSNWNSLPYSTVRQDQRDQLDPRDQRELPQQ